MPNHVPYKKSIFFRRTFQDFIQFKASLLSDEAKNDPISKAETIREIVESIHKIPDAIKQEIYIQSCAEIMQISEDVLFRALAQINQKNNQKSTKKFIPGEPVALIKKTADSEVKVDRIFELERQIISILLTYGNQELNFEEPISITNEDGELIEETQKYLRKYMKRFFWIFNKTKLSLVMKLSKRFSTNSLNFIKVIKEI